MGDGNTILHGNNDDVTDRIAALEAEVERLKCCGNCDNYLERTSNCRTQPTMVARYNTCHFTPSRWKERDHD